MDHSTFFFLFNSSYTGGLLHCYMYMLDEPNPFVILEMSVYFVAFSLFLVKNPLSKQYNPKQTPHNVASDLGLRCLPMTLLRGFPVRMG